MPWCKCLEADAQQIVFRTLKHGCELSTVYCETMCNTLHVIVCDPVQLLRQDIAPANASQTVGDCLASMLYAQLAVIRRAKGLLGLLPHSQVCSTLVLADVDSAHAIAHGCRVRCQYIVHDSSDECVALCLLPCMEPFFDSHTRCYSGCCCLFISYQLVRCPHVFVAYLRVSLFLVRLFWVLLACFLYASC